MGESDEPGKAPLRLYCPTCQDVYSPTKKAQAALDGAFFGTSFAHMFMMNFPELFRQKREDFVPQAYGFRIHASSIDHPPRMVYDYRSQSVISMPRLVPKFADSETHCVKRAFLTTKKAGDK